MMILGYIGAYQDPVTEGYPLGNGYRMYVSELMRFSSPDDWSPFGEGGIHPYAYCAGDPINHRDLLGIASSLTEDTNKTASTAFGAFSAFLGVLSTGVGLFGLTLYVRGSLQTATREQELERELVAAREQLGTFSEHISAHFHQADLNTDDALLLSGQLSNMGRPPQYRRSAHGTMWQLPRNPADLNSPEARSAMTELHPPEGGALHLIHLVGGDRWIQASRTL